MTQSKNPDDQGINVSSRIWDKRKLLEILYATGYWIQIRRKYFIISSKKRFFSKETLRTIASKFGIIELVKLNMTLIKNDLKI